MMKRSSILIADDEESHRLMLRAHLEREGFDVVDASDGAEAVKAVEDRFYDLVLLDVKMPTMDGLEALKRIKRLSPAIPVIMMTAYGSIESAVDALKAGAEDYLTKPMDMDELILKVKKAIRYSQLQEEHLLQKERLGTRFDFSSIIGTSPNMKELFETLSMVVSSDATILLLGESGTGKEVVANAIHQNSPRADRPYVKVSCAALPETLLESELFGHEKGAFTGAISKKKGRFELADGGTLFLDEIGEMSQTTQTKLLRVLQEREFEPVGGTRTVKVDVRIIAATNKNLDKEVREGRFREDLYYRLNVVPVVLPPLRERREDIPLLADHFLKLYNKKNNRMIKGFEPKVIDIFMRYHWPGNVRELENLVERGVIMCRGEMISTAELPLHLREDAEGSNEPEPRSGITLKEVEKETITRTLSRTGGNRTKAAQILGITRKTLLNKIKEYGIE